MLDIKEEELKTILPLDGPSTEEVKKYLEKYSEEYIVIKCGGSVLIDQNLFDIFIQKFSLMNALIRKAEKKDSLAILNLIFLKVNIKTRFIFFRVPKAGIEPAQGYPYCPLKTARLPVPPLRQ